MSALLLPASVLLYFLPVGSGQAVFRCSAMITIL